MHTVSVLRILYNRYGKKSNKKKNILLIIGEHIDFIQKKVNRIDIVTDL